MGQIPIKAAGFRLPLQDHPHPSKKTLLHQPVSLAEVQTELYWRSLVLMILRILIYKDMRKPCMEKGPFIRANSTNTVPQVEAKRRNLCLLVLILEPGL